MIAKLHHIGRQCTSLLSVCRPGGRRPFELRADRPVLGEQGGQVGEVDGDLSGSVNIDGYGNIDIFGDVLDSGDNHVWVGTLGGFTCDNMELSGSADEWLTFGPQEGPISPSYAVAENRG